MSVIYIIGVAVMKAKAFTPDSWSIPKTAESGSSMLRRFGVL